MMPIEEAAYRLGFTRQHAWYLVRRGSLRGVRVGRFWFVPESAVRDFRRGKPGPPPKLSDTESAEMMMRYAAGEGAKALAAEYKVSMSTFNRIRRHYKYLRLRRKASGRGEGGLR